MCITKENLDLGDDKDELGKLQKEHEGFCKFLKETLGDQITKVEVSTRLVDTPSCIVTGENGWTANMERIMKAQALGNNQMGYMKSQKTLEINPSHVIIRAMKRAYEKDDNEHKTKNMIWLMYEASVLDGGFSLDDSKSFTDRIRRLITLGLDMDGDELPDLETDELPDLETDDDNETESMETVD